MMTTNCYLHNSIPHLLLGLAKIQPKCFTARKESAQSDQAISTVL